MNQQDDFSDLAARNLRSGEPSPPSNRAYADPTRIEEPRSAAPNGIDKYDSFCGSMIEHNSNQTLVIEGYRVPSSLAAMVVPEPLASPPRSIAGILMEFGGAAVVAIVVALFVTRELTAPWNIGASGKTEERSADAATREVSAPSPVKLSAPSQSPTTAHLESQSQWVRMVGAPPSSAAATTEAAADAVLSRSPPLVSAKGGSDEEDERRQTAAVSPTGPSERASPLLAQFVVTRRLQGELKRVGCDPGNIDGDWNAASRRALENFNKHTGSKLDVRVASLDALGVIRSKRSRICPLACDRGSRFQGNRCVPVETPSGRRDADRNHMKRASAGRPTTGAAPTASAPSGSPPSEPAGVDWRQNANF
jgi:hypothetical protein